MSVQVWSNEIIICLAADTKPTSGVAQGTRAYETDTGNWFILNSAGAWVAFNQAPGGGTGGGSMTVVANTELPAAAALAVGTANPTTPMIGAGAMLWNGTTWDPFFAPQEVTVLASAARTASLDSADLVNYNFRGVVVHIDATASAATPSVVFTIQGKSSLGSDYYTILASAAVTGTGNTTLRVYPGITAAANLAVSDVLPRIWRVSIAHGDADSLTYSVSANYIL